MINKIKWDKKFKEWFKLPDTTDLFYYRNPSDFNRFTHEMVNPTHKGYIYGYRSKISHKGNNPVKIGKIYIYNILLGCYNEITSVFNLVISNLNIAFILYNLFLGLILLTFIMKIPALEYFINNRM